MRSLLNCCVWCVTPMPFNRVAKCIALAICILHVQVHEILAGLPFIQPLIAGLNDWGGNFLLQHTPLNLARAMMGREAVFVAAKIHFQSPLFGALPRFLKLLSHNLRQSESFFLCVAYFFLCVRMGNKIKGQGGFMPAGQPTKYDPVFCDRVIEMGKYGASKAEMACELGICRKTFLNYEVAHPEFLHAVNKAVEHSQAWWEKNGRVATFGGVDNFNATSFIFNMKNRFPGDWKDNKQLDHTSSDRSMSPASTSDAALLEIATGSK